MTDRCKNERWKGGDEVMDACITNGSSLNDNSNKDLTGIAICTVYDQWSLMQQDSLLKNKNVGKKTDYALTVVNQAICLKNAVANEKIVGTLSNCV